MITRAAEHNLHGAVSGDLRGLHLHLGTFRRMPAQPTQLLRLTEPQSPWSGWLALCGH